MPRIKFPENETTCFYCGAEKSIPNWSKTDNHRCCHYCYKKMVWNPKKKKITNERRIRFLGKQVYLDENPRIGVCNWCGNLDGDKIEGVGIIVTHMHHWFYLPIMVWSCTEELCNSCHGKLQ